LGFVHIDAGGSTLAKPNYAFAKRQRDLAKKQKAEAKRARKAAQAPATEPEPEAPPLPPGDKNSP
jgi:hypothetical protein